MKPEGKAPTRGPAIRAAAIALLLATTYLQNQRSLPGRYAVRCPVFTVERAPFPLVVRAVGAIQAKQLVTVKAPFDGPIRAKQFQEGQQVKAHTVLFEIGRNQIEAAYMERKHALRNAREDVVKAKRNVKAQEMLFRHQAIPQGEVEEARRILGRVEQDLALTDFSMQKITELWNKNVFAAPFDGTIVKDLLQNDRDVTAGQDILSLADLSEYRVVAQVDEVDVAKIRAGQAADVLLQAFEGKTLRAHVMGIGAQLNGDAMPKVPVTLRLDGTEGVPLLLNLSAEVRIDVGRSDPVISVPLAAIDNTEGRICVWSITPSQRLSRVPIVLGRLNPDAGEVTKGLIEGMKVCRTADPHWTEGALALGYE